MKKSFFLLIVLSLTLFFSACSSGGSKDKTVVFADAGWDSIQIHNAVAGYILEKGFGFTWSQVDFGTLLQLVTSVDGWHDPV